MSVTQCPINSFYELAQQAGKSDELHFTLGGDPWLLVDDEDPDSDATKTLINCNDPAVTASFATIEDFLTCKINGRTLKEQWSELTDVSCWYIRFDSLEEFVQTIKDGCEIQFSLDGRQYLLAENSDQQSYRQLTYTNYSKQADPAFIAKFRSLDELLSYKIGGQPLSKLWTRMRNVDYG